MIETIASILRNKRHGIYSVPSEATVHEAVSIMAEKGVAAVLVLAQGKLAGIVSAKDYGSKVVLQGLSARDSRVHQIMTSPVVTVTLEASVLECMAIMTRRHIRHLPVFDKSELVGVVSMGDLASAVIADQAFQIDQLMTYVGQK
ncbi:MAG TPA: CBS domain-containing protein [Candidatus Sulfotelmatobacter sp.]